MSGEVPLPGPRRSAPPLSSRSLVEVIDYLLVTTHSQAGAVPAGSQGPIELPRGIRIERLNAGFAERLMEAAEPKGECWEPTRQFHVVHAYVCAFDEEDGELPEEIFTWDSERRLYPCVQLSRLIRDNNTGTEYAIRRLIRADGSETLIPFNGYDSHVAYRLYPERRAWIDIAEAVELGALLRAFWEGPTRPDRVGRALRRADSATAERFLQDALPLVVAGLESLVSVGSDRVTAQFAQRVPLLAVEAGVEELDEARCRALYRNRSALVHGTEIDLSRAQDLDEFGQGFVLLQETLRRIVRRAIEEEAFAARFADGERVKSAWPASVQRRGETIAI